MLEKRIEQHERALKILEGMKEFDRRAQSFWADVDGESGQLFPRLAEKWANSADTCERAFHRLELCYKKLITEMQES